MSFLLCVDDMIALLQKGERAVLTVEKGRWGLFLPIAADCRLTRNISFFRTNSKSHLYEKTLYLIEHDRHAPGCVRAA